MPKHAHRAGDTTTIRVGLISDTHGLLRPEALAWLRGCHYIVHAGDVGEAGILAELGAVAPVTAVRGNMDTAPWAAALHDTARLDLGPVSIFVIHDLSQLAPAASTRGIRVVVCGHSHKPSVEERDGLLYVNPGSAGPRRFSLPISIGELIVKGTTVAARTVALVTTP